jgi:ParB-like chromosome segregation protein Spo0J
MQNISIEYLATKKLVPYAENARAHSDRQVEDIAASIREFGFVNPVLIDERGEIVGGHGRVLAASKLGLAKVPVVRLSHLSDRQVRALRIADNKIALSSSWDLEKLSKELSALAEVDFDLSVTGFDEQELDALLKDDMAILPESWKSEVLATESGSGRSEPEVTSGELTQVARPRTTDDEHSTFELVMKHSNKLRLVEVLSRIRSEEGLPLLEDALMVLVKTYQEIEK